MIAAERQGRRIRYEYLQAVLRQEMGWHDQTRTAEVASRMSEDVLVSVSERSVKSCFE